MKSEVGITQELPVPVKRVGAADIIGFGQDGVTILRNTFRPEPRLAIKNFGYNDGWHVEKHVRIVGDTTGNGLADIIGFGDAGVLHVRYAADLRKKGFVDLIGFGDAGVFVALNNGNGNFAPAKLVLKDFGYVVGGWKVGRHLRFLADTTGDGLPDIVGFGESSVFVSFNNGDGTFQHTPFKDLGIITPGELGFHPRFVADTTGDGLGDIVGFGSGGVYVARNNGDGTFATATIVLYEFGYDHGWRVDKHPRFLADLTGNGAVDIVGFGEDAVWVSYNDGKGNFPAAFAFNDGQWAVDKTVRWVSNMF
ncbi:hypothetical protein FA13DRAFT_1757730 [Coprinellus micaceus]|uniref:Uncharacterized protein n=1 Tax=Coprinellus micaceus TaxID=71717 RepID=A0A4Y7SG00_COPMI|nr:hypothetical protein FA13DRAFT_1757730 [Coprinellus micaceus]